MDSLLNNITYQLFSGHAADVQGTLDDISQKTDIKKSYIHLFMCAGGRVTFQFSPHYARQLQAGRCFTIYNPDADLPCTLQLSPDVQMLWIALKLHDLHELIQKGLEHAPVFSSANANKKFYDENELSPLVTAAVHQMMESRLEGNMRELFNKGKICEVISLFFSEKGPDAEKCPFLNDEEVMRKLKKAKEILFTHFASPPTIVELAKSVHLNEFQLKAGFKEIYGNTPYQYLLDFKLEKAQQLLQSGQYQVSEVAHQLGYSNISHFIDAFKKKYGVTPKKIIP